MRQTLYLLPAADFSIYITALRRSRVEAVRRVTSRFGVTEKDTDRLNEVIVDALGRGPLTQRELTEQIKPRAGKKVRAWMDRVWSVFKPALAEGLACYGPDRGQEVTLVRIDQWLPRQIQVSEEEGKQVLLRRYLSAYGPATLQDFCRWSGISMKEATPIWRSLDGELVEVSIEDKRASVLRKDYERLLNASLREPVLRLLPGFDPYMLAHAEKDHLVDDALYKRVYRNQGWISPVVFLNGKVIGIWSAARRGKGSSFEVELFQHLEGYARQDRGADREFGTFSGHVMDIYQRRQIGLTTIDDELRQRALPLAWLGHATPDRVPKRRSDGDAGERN